MRKREVQIGNSGLEHARSRSDSTQPWVRLLRVVKFCPNAFWEIIVSGRLTQLSLRLAALQGFQFSLDLVRDKAVRAGRSARKICNGVLAGIAPEPAVALKREILSPTKTTSNLSGAPSTAWSKSEVT